MCNCVILFRVFVSTVHQENNLNTLRRRGREIVLQVVVLSCSLGHWSDNQQASLVASVLVAVAVVVVASVAAVSLVAWVVAAVAVAVSVWLVAKRSAAVFDELVGASCGNKAEKDHNEL